MGDLQLYLCLAMFHDRYVVISYQNWNEVINLHKPAPVPTPEKQEIWHCPASDLCDCLWTQIKQCKNRQLLRRLVCSLGTSCVFYSTIHFVCMESQSPGGTLVTSMSGQVWSGTQPGSNVNLATLLQCHQLFKQIASLTFGVQVIKIWIIFLFWSRTGLK